MEFISPLIISFFLIFISELGDKTQLLVLSFSTKIKTFTIILGIALGSFFSHGIAILFGSFLGNSDNYIFHNAIKLITNFSFIILGIFTLFHNDSNTDNKFISKISNLKLNYIILIALSIAIGEIGDKTFLAALGLGIQYSNFKFLLILGATLGMILSNLLAIILGKFLSKYLSSTTIQNISGILFIIFGISGFIV